MVTVTAFLLALNAAAPASAALYGRLGRMALPQETSPMNAVLAVANREPAPEPTSAPEYPDFGSMPLLKRDAGTDTCGFHTDDGIEITCGSTATCTNSGGFRDCCLSTRCATSSFRTTCFDSTATECATRAPNGAHCCTYDYAPFCVTYLWATSATPGTSFTLIACESVQYTGFPSLAAENPNSDSTTTTRTTSSRTTSSTTSGSTTDSTDTTGTGGTPGQTSPPADGGSGGQSAPVGAIVGGVVGGLAVLGIAAVAIVFFLRKRKSHDSPTVPPSTIGGGMAPSPYGSPPPQPMNQATPPPGFPPTQPYGGYYQGTPSPSQGYAQSNLYPAAAGGLQPGSPDPSKHYSNVSSEQSYMPIQGNQNYQPYQPPIAEMSANHASGTYGNRAELS